MYRNEPPNHLRKSFWPLGAGASLLCLSLVACGDTPVDTPESPSTGQAATTGAQMPAVGGATTTSGTQVPTTDSSVNTTGSAVPEETTGAPVATTTTTGGETPATGAVADSGTPQEATDGSAQVPPVDGAAPDAEPEPVMDLGKGDGNDVITIGDSWMTMYGGGIEGGLDREGTDYRHYGVAATRFLNGQIPGQYRSAKRRNPNIATVIMTGGGNDILLGGYDCDTPAGCQEYITDLVAGLNELWTEMSNDGVTDVIYVNYSRDAGDSPADARPVEMPRAAICEEGPIRCHSLETTDLVMGALPDGIHPTGAAHDRIAAALVQLMEEKGMRR